MDGGRGGANRSNASIKPVSGRAVRRSAGGRGPLLPAAVLVLALLMLSRLAVGTPYWRVALAEFAFGAGLGFTMQTIVVAIQNAVPYRVLGAATSSATSFRQMGGTVGAAIFGAVLASRLASELAAQLGNAPETAAVGGAIDANNIQAIQALPEPTRGLVLEAFARALDAVFLFGVPCAIVALVVALFLREVPLRSGPAPVEDGAPAEPVAAHL